MSPSTSIAATLRSATARHEPPEIRPYWRSKSAVADLADLDRAEDPLAIDEVGLRPGGDAVGRLDRAFGVVDRLPRRALLRDERPGQIGRIGHEDTDDDEAVGGMVGRAST